MQVEELFINSKSILNDAGEIDWGIVKNTPSIVINDNKHSHDDRYYRKSDIDSRIKSLKSSIDDLTEKVDNLFN